jgi:hypothetical protein
VGYEFPEFGRDSKQLERLAPGISRKIIIGCMVGDKRYDDNPRISQIQFVEAQVRAIGKEITSTGLAGIALVGHTYETSDVIKRLDGLLQRYFRL